ncbi:GDSL esterase/lipase At5g45960-like [Syzygium oleosum]|uniref:GDSL esterase/lipase At5g45960-like n=1 Tax=Syzygium oleosum TaxID=219896 RepID=UPI0011D2567A|nr:GDSL esterase/lipase At5g45960-like [Syzygium oleosum]
MALSKEHGLALLLNHIIVFYVTLVPVFNGGVCTRILTLQRPSNGSSVSAVIVFGDSTVDTGNNDYINTLSKGNVPPYGQDFVNHTPTGRFSNGRLIPDLIASYFGVKELVPPYLDPSLSTEDLMTGVCFASAGSGYDPFTAEIPNVISMKKQLQYFKAYRKRLEMAIGKDRTRNIINEALFVISCGTNDFINNYYGLPFRRQSFTPQMYQQFILNHVKNFTQTLLNQGARRIAVVGLPPMGCLPVVINLNSGDPFEDRGCIEEFSSVAWNYNKMLQKELGKMEKSTQSLGVVINYIDIYNPLMQMIKAPTSFGFEDVNSGCCGTGIVKVSFSCNMNSYVCPDASKYVFWDLVHPTERAYSIVFDAVLPSIVAVVKGI